MAGALIIPDVRRSHIDTDGLIEPEPIELGPIVHNLHQPAVHPVIQIAAKVVSAWNYLGHCVDQWTDNNLPQPIAKMVQDTFRDLPVRAASYFEPGQIASFVIRRYIQI